jgi:protein-disulfide isomerase
MTHDGTRGTATRRRVLLGVGAGATAALAGCTGGTASGAETVPVRGNPDADVVLEVFEDFGCGFCQSYVQNLFPSIRSQYLDDGLIRYEHRDFITTDPPDAVGPSQQAANAAREVLDRHGDAAFWEFAEALYDNQGRLSAEAPGLFGELAGNLGFDAGPVEDAAVDLAHDSAVQADIDRANDLNLGGTPSFVLDGSQVDTGGARDLGDVVALVAEEIDQALSEQ